MGIAKNKGKPRNQQFPPGIVRRSPTLPHAVLALVACALQSTNAQDVPPPKPATDQRLDNLDNDAALILRQLPGVAQVTRHGPGRPSHRIIHLLDWHFVSRDMYAADLRSQSNEPLSDKDIDGAWKELLSEVTAVQKEQMLVLDCLVQHHGLRRIYTAP